MRAMIIIGVLLYNLTLLVGTVILIESYDWSVWTFIFTIMLMAEVKKVKKE